MKIATKDLPALAAGYVWDIKNVDENTFSVGIYFYALRYQVLAATTFPKVEDETKQWERFAEAVDWVMENVNERVKL